MKKSWIYRSLLMMVLLWVSVAIGNTSENASGQPPAPAENATDRKAFVLDIQGPIGPATRDFLTRSLQDAAQRDAALVIIRLDTPGGLDASTRDIIKVILNSSVPVATFVAPQGARAASAGTYILYASHIAAMSPATNVGAATPVAIIGGAPPAAKDSLFRKRQEDQQEGEDEPPDEEQQDTDMAGSPDDPMTQKVINDSVAYLRGLAAKHGRNEDWAERAVREAVSITSEEALDLGVIDLIADDVADLLVKIDGMVIELQGVDHVMDTSGLVIERLMPSWRDEILAAITSPTIAYMLLLIGVYGLILEGYHPGAILPGVVGAICLLTALYAFQMLPVNYAGLALILLGVILMIAEVMAPSFGVLGFGGIIAMVIGSVILFDSDVPGFAVSRSLIAAVAMVASLGLMAIIGLAVKARNRPVVAGREQLIGTLGTALHSFESEGHVFTHGERWNAVSEVPVTKDQAVVVTGLTGLTLRVTPVDEVIQEQNDV